MSIIVTGAAGFIGFYTAKALLERGERVIGIDNLNSYYGIGLKQARLNQLAHHKNFIFQKVDIADELAVKTALDGEKPTQIIHLAAQAGVRYSMENPAAYIRSNLEGHGVILELARQYEIENTVYASSSSVYGGNTKIPFSEDDRTDDPVSFYGATKKSNELLSHSYARLYGLSLTGLRFFTVYGPWGRPDMAYWIFADKITKGEPIHIFNNGQMSRDFTYIDDIVEGVLAALDRPVSGLDLAVSHRIYNLGNDQPEELMTLVSLLETELGKEAEKSFEPMQQGDVQRTWADISAARQQLGYEPKISLEEGLSRFTSWYVKEWHKQ